MPLLATLAAGAAAVYGWGRAVAAAAGAAAAAIYDWSPKSTQIIDNPDPATNAYMGNYDSVDISHDNNTMLIGASRDDTGAEDAGVGYVFTKSNGVWSNVAKLTASDASVSGYLFQNARISGDGSTIVAGSWAPGNGKVYIYSKPESGWTNATETQKLDGASEDSNAAYFGYAVSISEDGSTIAIGDYDNGSGTNPDGAVFIYTKSGSTWSQQAKLTPSDAASVLAPDFGRHIDITSDGNTIAISAHTDDENSTSNSGSVYIFTRSGSSWSQRDKITAETNIGQNDYFGSAAVALSNDGNTLAVSTNNSAGGTDNQFYVFTYDEGSSLWSQEAEITYGDALAAAGSTDLQYTVVDSQFGEYVSISGDGNTIAVAAPYEEDPSETYRAGAVYIFTRSNGTWQFKRRLTDEVLARARNYYFGQHARLSNDGTHLLAPSWIEAVGSYNLAGRLYVYEANEKAFWEDGSLMETLDDGTTSSRYGASGDLSGTGEYAVVGAWGYNSSVGRAYIYKRSGSTWSQQAAIEAQDGVGGNLEQMGYSSAMNYSGDTVAISQHNEDSGKGTVQVFTRSGTTWSHQAELQPTDLATNDYFGKGLAFAGSGIDISDNGDVVVVGATFQDSGGTSNTGAVYVFRRTGSTWAQEQKFTVSPVTGSDQLGSAVAISGDGKYVVVGTPYEDGDSADSTSNAGVVYVFKKSETANTWTQQARLVSSPSQEVSDYLGWSVAVNYDGTKIVSGAILDEIGVSNSGVAYIFTRSLTGTTWSLEAKIEPNDRAASDNFGSSVDISADGSIVVVGAKQDDDGGTSSGALYFFTNSSGGWGQVKKIAGTYTSNLIGQTTRMSSDGMYAIAGNYDYSSAQGQSYIYKATNTPVSYDWSTISAFNGFPSNMPSSASNTRFGCDTAISPNGEHAIVGALNFSSGKGAFYYYKRSNPTSNFISYSNKTDSPDQSNSNYFGSSVALNYRGDIAFIGAYNYSNGGAAYVYTRAGTTWTGSSAIQPSDIASGDELAKGKANGAMNGKGIAASYDGKTFVAGAAKHDHSTYSNAGAAWVFVESGGTWSQQAKLTASDAAANDLFGERLHISGNGNYVIAGARYKNNEQGAAYIFKRAEGGTSWSQEAKLVHPSPTNYDRFGEDVAISEYGNTVVIGVPSDDASASNAGTAYVFVRNGTTWTQQAVLEGDTTASGDQFGSAVSISADGNIIAVGAADDDDGATSSGVVFVFTRSGTTWTQQGKVYPSGSAYTGFGWQVNVSPTGDFIIVGDAEQSTDAGRIFIYKTDADGS